MKKFGFKDTSMSLARNFNRQKFWSDFPVLISPIKFTGIFMVRKKYIAMKLLTDLEFELFLPSKVTSASLDFISTNFKACHFQPNEDIIKNLKTGSPYQMNQMIKNTFVNVKLVTISLQRPRVSTNLKTPLSTAHFQKD